MRLLLKRSLPKTLSLKRVTAFSALALLASVVGVLPAQADFSRAPKAQTLYQNLRTKDGFNAAELAVVRKALANAQFLPALIHTAQHSKEKTLSWDAYRPIAVNPSNVENGLAFMQAQHKWLAKAEKVYGVPPAVITAVLGVETKYGTYTGHVRALDALSTMAFKHPTRGAFFMSELEQFFVLCRDDNFKPETPESSYAGALGYAQFMPSNYLRLGVDFDGNGRVDLWSAADAIGSIANYLVHYDHHRGWHRGQALVLPAGAPQKLPQALNVNARHAPSDLTKLAHAGIVPATATTLPHDLPAGFIRLDGAKTTRADWIALPNFYAIMSYNPRIFYAMAVSQLTRALKQGSKQTTNQAMQHAATKVHG